MLDGGESREIDQDRSHGRPLLPEERRLRIVEMIRRRGAVTVGAIEADFGISSMTARRDLAILEKEGLLRRTRGGAMLPVHVGQEDSFQHRLVQAVEAKRRLAAAAVGMLDDGDSVFIDSSTTAYYAARLIVEQGCKVTILTNSVPVMDLFRAVPHNAELIGIGGSLRKLTLSFVGPSAVAVVSQHFGDKVFFSSKGVAPGGFLTDPDSLEAEVKRTMIERAGRSVVLLDGSKFEERGLSVIAHLSEVTTVLAADAGVAALGAAAAYGVEVVDV